MDWVYAVLAHEFDELPLVLGHLLLREKSCDSQSLDNFEQVDFVVKFLGRDLEVPHVSAHFRLATAAVQGSVALFHTVAQVVVPEDAEAFYSLFELLLLFVKLLVAPARSGPVSAGAIVPCAESFGQGLLDHGFVEREGLVAAQQEIRKVLHHAYEATNQRDHAHDGLPRIDVRLEHGVLDKPVVEVASQVVRGLVVDAHHAGLNVRRLVGHLRFGFAEGPIVEPAIAEFDRLLQYLIRLHEADVPVEHATVAANRPVESAVRCKVIHVKELV